MPKQTILKEGIYIIDKPPAWTSFDVVNKIKKTTGIKKVGHAGTLDPLATGVLVVCVGRKFTKHISTIVDSDKEYVATIQFGRTTASYDGDTPFLAENNLSLKKDQIEQIIYAFKGKQQQIPPMYSAVKKNGCPLYKLARQGIEIAREPKDIEISDIEILSIKAGKFAEVSLRIVCSKGTYVRTLAYDLGQKAGCGAYLKKLVRTRVGDYSIEQSNTIDNLLNEKEIQSAEEK